MPTRIVLVDDHAILREGLRLRLEQEAGLQVVGEANNADEAHACVKTLAPDLVLMDLNLPGEGGLEATKKIKASFPAVRIIVLTGETAESTAQLALQAGANGYLRKEDASSELVKAIALVLSGKTYLSPEAATVIAQTLASGQPGAKPEAALSEQELAVLKGLAEGRSYKEIADHLKVSPKTVETYRARLVKKTDCPSRAELVRYAIRKGIVSL